MDASDGTTQKVANSFNFAKINFKGAVSTAEESTNAKQYGAMVNLSPPVKNKKSMIGLIQAQLRHGGTIYSKTIRSQPTTTTVPPTTTTTTLPPTAIVVVNIPQITRVNTTEIELNATFFVPSSQTLIGAIMLYSVNSDMTLAANVGTTTSIVPTLTTGGTNYSFSASQTGLTPGTTYYFQTRVTASGITSSSIASQQTAAPLLLVGIEPTGTADSGAPAPVSSYASSLPMSECDSCSGLTLKGNNVTGPQGFTPLNLGIAVRLRVYFKGVPTFTGNASFNVRLLRDSGTGGTTGQTGVGATTKYSFNSTQLIPAFSDTWKYLDVPIGGMGWPFQASTTYYLVFSISDQDGAPGLGSNWTVAVKNSDTSYKSAKLDSDKFPSTKCISTDIENGYLVPTEENSFVPYVALYNY